MKMRVGSTLRKVLRDALVLRAVGVSRAVSIEFMNIQPSLDSLPAHDFGGYIGTLQSARGVARSAYVDLTVYTRDGRFVR